MKQQVNYQFKALALMAMIMIVAGHAKWGGIDFAYHFFSPSSFHVALFVFISGYFYKPSNEQKPIAFLKKKTEKLLVPMYLINLAYGVFAQIMHQIGFRVGGQFTAWNVLVDPLIGGHAFGWDAPLWFIAPLFFAEMIDFGLRLILRVGDNKRKEFLLIVLYLVLGFCAIQYGGAEGLETSVELAIGRTGLFLAYYALGRIYKVFLEAHDNAPSLQYFAVNIAVQFLLVVSSRQMPYATPCWLQFNTDGVLTLLFTANGIAFWLRACRYLAPIIERNSLLKYASDSTFSIMAHHLMGFLVINTFFLGLHQLGYFDAFSIADYLSNSYYKAIPGSINGDIVVVFCTLYVVAGFAVSLFMHRCWLQLTNKVGKLHRIQLEDRS